VILQKHACLMILLVGISLYKAGRKVHTKGQAIDAPGA